MIAATGATSQLRQLGHAIVERPLYRLPTSEIAAPDIVSDERSQARPGTETTHHDPGR